MIKIVFRLQHLPGRQTAFARHFQRARKLLRIEFEAPMARIFPACCGRKASRVSATGVSGSGQWAK